MDPWPQGNPIYDGLTSLLAGVLKQRTQPEDLPGLEAQMPGSPLVLMLNRPGVRIEAALHVLGGDLEGAGILGRLKTLATDLYYREDHDLVVNTPSMLGGADRAQGVRYWIDTGSEVTHFHYFMRPDTAGRLVDALTDGRADFHPLEAQPFAVTADDYRKRAPVPQPVVFVLPGILGSELSVDDAAIWMDIFALAVGGLARLRSDTKARASGLIRSAYGSLCTYLAATHEVVPFPYDWRLSIKDAAEALRQALDDKLLQAEAQEQPIRILAHSMGGLVVRAMLATPDGKQTWSRICQHPGARFIMLGTPNGGSHAILAMLIGRDALVKKLALLDLKHDYAGLLATITAFQGVLDLLPDTGTLDLFDPAQWQALYDQDAPPDRVCSRRAWLRRSPLDLPGPYRVPRRWPRRAPSGTWSRRVPWTRPGWSTSPVSRTRRHATSSWSRRPRRGVGSACSPRPMAMAAYSGRLASRRGCACSTWTPCTGTLRAPRRRSRRCSIC